MIMMDLGQHTRGPISRGSVRRFGCHRLPYSPDRQVRAVFQPPSRLMELPLQQVLDAQADIAVVTDCHGNVVDPGDATGVAVHTRTLRSQPCNCTMLGVSMLA